MCTNKVEFLAHDQIAHNLEGANKTFWSGFEKTFYVT